MARNFDSPPAFSQVRQRFGTLRSAPVIVSLLLALAHGARADVKVASLFTHNMVLQQGTQVPVWGWADDGEVVTVQFQGQRVTDRARDGRWRVNLKNLRPGGPDSLVIDGRNRIQLDNVMVGEVWLCSGGSNLEWPLHKAHDPQGDIINSINPNLRLFTVEKSKADDPQGVLRQAWNLGKFAWQESSPQSCPEFSAVAFYFGRELQKARGVPVGLIQVAWDESPAEAWINLAALDANQEFRVNIVGKYLLDLSNYQEAKAKYDREAAELAKKNQQPQSPPPTPPAWKPAELYNGMLAPLMPFAIRGAIWYQGEANVTRAHQYRNLLPDLIKSWRKDWGQGDFPFLTVQLAPYLPAERSKPDHPVDSDWAELREAQLLAAKQSKVGLVITTDVGEERNPNPLQKAPVGERLALAARALAYGERITYSGPIYKSLRKRTDKLLGERLLVSFDHTGRGLEARGGELQGFAICGADQKFVRAQAEILPDNTIAVSHPDIKKPVHVRYGWADFPEGNLWNRDGLPASPFRTDDFQMVTAPKY